MALNIKNQEVEDLLEAVISITGESKTEAVRKALEERKQRLGTQFVSQPSEERLLAFLQDEIWRHIPEQLLGTTISRSEEEEILGYGEYGV